MLYGRFQNGMRSALLCRYLRRLTLFRMNRAGYSKVLLSVQGGGGKSNFGADYSLDYLPVEPGDTYITLRYDRLGEHVAVEIPLPEVEP